MVCTHLDSIRDVTPSANSREDCLKTQSSWMRSRVRPRLCRPRGHVGSCDSFARWAGCYVDEEMLDFTGTQTLHLHTSSVTFEDLGQR